MYAWIYFQVVLEQVERSETEYFDRYGYSYSLVYWLFLFIVGVRAYCGTHC